MKRAVSKTLLLIAALILFTSSASAQWRFSVATEQQYSTNPFLTPLSSESYVSGVDLGIEKSIDEFNVGVYGSNYNFFQLPERDFFWYQAGFWRETKYTTWGAYAERRMNQENYSFYDYTDITGYLRHSWEGSGINWSIASSLNFTMYDELGDMDNLHVYTSILGRKSFETRTTLFTGVSFNYKNYYYNTIENVASTTMGGRGRMGGGTSSITPYTTQFVLNSRVAQSITDYTGLAVQANYRMIVASTSNNLIAQGYFYDESYLFDDPVNFEGLTLGAELTQLLPWDMILKASVYYNDKNYPSQGIYIDAENYVYDYEREDEQMLYNLNIKKALPFSILGGSELRIVLSHTIMQNSSNSYWYDYDYSTTSLGLDFQF